MIITSINPKQVGIHAFQLLCQVTVSRVHTPGNKRGSQLLLPSEMFVAWLEKSTRRPQHEQRHPRISAHCKIIHTFLSQSERASFFIRMISQWFLARMMQLLYIHAHWWLWKLVVWPQFDGNESDVINSKVAMLATTIKFSGILLIIIHEALYIT